MGNPDFINGSGLTPLPPFHIESASHFFFCTGVSVLHYLQSVLPNVAVGGEVAYQYGPGIPGGGIAVVSGVGRYTGKFHYSNERDRLVIKKLIHRVQLECQRYVGRSWPSSLLLPEGQ